MRHKLHLHRNKEAIRTKVAELAHQIEAKCAQLDIRRLTVIPILNGAMLFGADLIRNLYNVEVVVKPVTMRSYAGTTSGEIEVLGTIPSVRGEDVLIVDTIYDTGKTWRTLVNHLRQQEYKSLRSCCLVSKQIGSPVSFLGWQEKPDAFLVGYGTDLDGVYRNLPDLWTVELEEARAS